MNYGLMSSSGVLLFTLYYRQDNARWVLGRVIHRLFNTLKCSRRERRNWQYHWRDGSSKRRRRDQQRDLILAGGR